MIKDAKKYFEAFASMLTDDLPSNWVEVRFSAIFYSEGNTYTVRYVDKNGSLLSTHFSDELCLEVNDFRDLFLSEGEPLWGAFLFVLNSNGSFRTHFDYDNCDGNGNKIFDADTEMKLFEENINKLK